MARRPRGGASRPARASRADGATRSRETYHHEAARAALLRVHRGDGSVYVGLQAPSTTGTVKRSTTTDTDTDTDTESLGSIE